LPVYLNALSGRGSRDHRQRLLASATRNGWASFIPLRLSVGVIVHDLTMFSGARRTPLTLPTEPTTIRLRLSADNMKFDLNDCVQRGHNYSIVDEVDSILIDEARTPPSSADRVRSRPTSTTRSIASFRS